MFQNAVGEDVFRASLKLYLETKFVNLNFFLIFFS